MLRIESGIAVRLHIGDLSVLHDRDRCRRNAGRLEHLLRDLVDGAAQLR